MHKMILENEDIILDDNTVLDVKGDVVLYLYGSGKVTLNIGDNSMVTVYHVGVDICNNIVVNLNGDNSQVLYNYDVVNYNDNKFSLTKGLKTKSFAFRIRYEEGNGYGEPKTQG